jgi:hypothetical protein
MMNAITPKPVPQELMEQRQKMGVCPRCASNTNLTGRYVMTRLEGQVWLCRDDSECLARRLRKEWRVIDGGLSTH